MIILPILVSLGTVAGIKDDIRARVVQAGFISPDFPFFGKHPILQITFQS
jgi:hypothetical protein